jgi:O-antigen/teichoic acid export membrane protein
MDIMLLGYWMTSQDVGLYLVAFQTAAVLTLVLGAFDVAFAPIMSKAWAKRDDVTFRESYAAVHRMAAMATVPLFVFVVIFRDEILSLFSREIGEGGLALTILALGYLVNAMTGGASTVLLMTGRSRTVLMNTIVYGIALVIGTALLIPQLGILGAAISASSALIGVNTLRVWQVWHCHAMFSGS